MSVIVTLTINWEGTRIVVSNELDEGETTLSHEVSDLIKDAARRAVAAVES